MAAAKRDLTSDDFDIDDDDDKRPDDDDDDGDGGNDRKRPARVTASPTSLVARSIGPVDEALVALASGPVNFSLMRAKLLAGERRTIDFRCHSHVHQPAGTQSARWGTLANAVRITRRRVMCFLLFVFPLRMGVAYCLVWRR